MVDSYEFYRELRVFAVERLEGFEMELRFDTRGPRVAYVKVERRGSEYTVRLKLSGAVTVSIENTFKTPERVFRTVDKAIDLLKDFGFCLSSVTLQVKSGTNT